MPRLAVPLVAVLIALPAHAIIIRDDVDDAQYVVDDEDYPALVDLIEPGDCIGTLIHPRFLLTVAHCAVDVAVGQVMDVGGETHAVAEVVLHPSWDDEDAFDIALVRLQTDVVNVAPLPIYRGSDEVGSLVTLVGRGVTTTGLVGEEGGDTDGLLRRATNVVTAANAHFFEITFDTGSAAEPLEGVGAAGDSGCPVFLDVNGVPHIAGLNSYGEEGSGGAIGVYGSLDYQTRVSRFLGFLDEHVDFSAVPPPEDTTDPGSGPDPGSGADGGAPADEEPVDDDPADEGSGGGDAGGVGPGDDETGDEGPGGEGPGGEGPGGEGPGGEGPGEGAVEDPAADEPPDDDPTAPEGSPSGDDADGPAADEGDLDQAFVESGCSATATTRASSPLGLAALLLLGLALARRRRPTSGA